jgi:hypothetical protein
MTESRVINLLRSFPVIRSVGKSTPQYHVGSVWENRLGLQVYRTVAKNLGWRLRKRSVAPNMMEFHEILDKDGILVLPNFLSANEFRAVLTEYHSAMEGRELEAFHGTANAKLFRLQIPVSESPGRFRQTIKSFRENETLDKLASMVIKRPIRFKASVYLDKYRASSGSRVDNDIENILHADLHTPTVKMFYYLSRVDETNGPFVYAKGSHKLNAYRLLHEFDLSIRQAKLRNGSPVPANLLEERGDEKRNVIRPWIRRKMRVQETKFSVEPNTLVVANNMGFHRRGEFTSEIPREALLINYRNEERLFL